MCHSSSSFQCVLFSLLPCFMLLPGPTHIYFFWLFSTCSVALLHASYFYLAPLISTSSTSLQHVLVSLLPCFLLLPGSTHAYFFYFFSTCSVFPASCFVLLSVFSHVSFHCYFVIQLLDSLATRLICFHSEVLGCGQCLFYQL